MWHAKNPSNKMISNPDLISSELDTCRWRGFQF